MRVLLAVLLVVGLVGCLGGETEPQPPFPKPGAKPPTVVVPPTPPKSTFIVKTSFKAPTKTKSHILRWHDIREALTSTHEACGLNAPQFQKGITQLQLLAQDTDFAVGVNNYVEAAKFTHDTKVRPTHYQKLTTTGDTKKTKISLRNKSRLEATKTAVGVAIASTSEWAGSIEDETTKKRSVEVIIKYAHPVQLTGESLRLIQALEEDAWKNLIREMMKKGFPLFRPSELVGKWSWDWKEGGVDEGTIIFELKQDRTFEADLKPTGVLVPGQVVSWGDGKWKLDGGRLVITMYRVGKRILGKGFPIKEHTVKWIDKEVKRFSPGEQILFTDGDELQYQADKK